eukprot:s2061_g9.t2
MAAPDWGPVPAECELKGVASSAGGGAWNKCASLSTSLLSAPPCDGEETLQMLQGMSQEEWVLSENKSSVDADHHFWRYEGAKLDGIKALMQELLSISSQVAFLWKLARLGVWVRVGQRARSFAPASLLFARSAMAPVAGSKFAQLVELHDGQVAQLTEENARLRKENQFLRVQLKLPEQFELEIDQPEFLEEAADEVLPEFSKENSEQRVSVNVKRISTVSLPRISMISGASFEADPASAIQGPPCLLARLSQSSGRQSTGKGAQPLDAPRTSGITEKLVLKSRWSKEIKTISTMGTQLLEEMHQTAHRESADGRYRRQNQARRTIFDRARPRWLPLHPGSSVRLTWDALALVLLFYDVVYIPLGALEPSSTTFTDVLEWFSLVFWTLDMVMTCLSAYYYKGEIVTEFRRIAKNYLKTWFFLDVVVLAPEWMERLGSAGEESGEAFKIIRSFRFLRTLRLLRLLKLQKLLAMVYDLIDSEFTFIMFTCIRLIFFIVVLNHCIACVWYWVGKSSLEGGYDSWMNIGGVPIIEASFPYRYTTSLHWSLTQFTPASMEISARNTGERVFSIMILFFALIVFSSVIGQVTSSMMSLQNMQASSRKQFWLLRRFLNARKAEGRCTVPKKSGNRIIRFLEQRVPKESQKVQQRDIKILSLLSEPLKDLLAWELHRRLLGRHRLFYILHGAIEAMMMRVCSVAVSESTLAEQDELFRAGESASHMTFVLSGHFHYQPGATKIHQKRRLACGRPGYEFQEPTDIGPYRWLVEPCLWTDWQHQGTFTAVKTGELCHLDPGKFADVMQAHIWPWNFCKQYALGFLDALNNLDAFETSDLLGQSVVDTGLEQALAAARAESDQVEMDWLEEINDQWSDSLLQKSNSMRSMVAARLTRASKHSR